ncbi:MAG: helix-turn-helix domain-containing protein [Pseudomonadota bacterium]
MTFRDTSDNNHSDRPNDDNPSHDDIRKTVRNSVKSFLKRYGDNQPEDLRKLVLEEVEKPLLEEVLRFTGGNQCRSAEILGVSRGTLRKRIQHYGLQ